MPVYAAGDTSPPALDAIDTDEVVDLVWDWSAELSADSDTIVQSTWTSSGGNIGDGATLVNSEAGNLTPPAPTIIASSTKTRAWFWFPISGTYTIENTVRTTNGRVHSKSATVVAKEL